MIQTRGLTKIYPSGTGCRNITLSVRPGIIFGLIGPNGAGKSTFVKTIIGLLRPTAGEGTLMGLPLGRTEARKKIGYLPELFRYHDWLSAREVLKLHARLAGLSAAEARSARMASRMKEVLEEVGLGGRGSDRVKHFSKGMQQRLGLACALLLDPDLILLDEPSSALDPIGRYEVRMLLQKLRQQGKTIFLNTHLLEDVEAVCDEVAFLHQGELKASGPIRDITGVGSWDIVVGGWDNTLLDALGPEPLPGLRLYTKQVLPGGSAILSAMTASREQIGWLNARLVELGAILYEARPANGGLEQWFLAMAEKPEGGAE